MSKTPTFKMSSNARFLYQRLQKAAIGETITYEDLSKEIGVPVRDAGSALPTALNRLQRDDSMVFVTIRGVGLKRANDEEITDQATAVTRSIRRKAARGYAKMMNADYDKLPPKKQLDFTIRASTLSAVAQMTTEKQMQKLSKAVVSAGTARELSISETIKAMLPKKAE